MLTGRLKNEWFVPKRRVACRWPVGLGSARNKAEQQMQFADLSVVKQRVQVGIPLPFNVRDADCSLLLARGRVVESSEQLAALLTRGALVDLSELRGGWVRSVEDAIPCELPGLWRDCMKEVGRAIRSTSAPAATPEQLMALIAH